MPATAHKKLAHSAKWFHALADETRLQIIDCLTDGEQCVCDLTEKLAAAQSRLSFHLKTLKDAGLVKDRRDGRWIYYSLNGEALEQLSELVADLKGQSRKGPSLSPCCK